MANEKRLIDANDLLLVIEEELAHESPFFTHEQNQMIDCGLRIAAKDIRHQPPVDAVEVVHGMWVHTDKAAHWYSKDECNICTYHSWDRHGLTHFNYCPNCGAKMDGGKDNES